MPVDFSHISSYTRKFSVALMTLHFSLFVFPTGSVSPPTIKVNASLVNTRCSSLTVECSVENSRGLILSWFRGRERLKTTSSPNLSTRVFLPLEIQYHDGDNYSCLAENPVEEKATKLHTEDTCLKNEGMMMTKHWDTMLFLSVSIPFVVEKSKVM